MVATGDFGLPAFRRELSAGIGGRQKKSAEGNRDER
jgi:hypothetical protein